MLKALLLGSVLAVGGLSSSALGPAAFAQDSDRVAPENHPSNGGPGIRAGNITATGATVPNPGRSQGAGTTDLDRGVQREDNKITEGICKGC